MLQRRLGIPLLGVHLVGVVRCRIGGSHRLLVGVLKRLRRRQLLQTVLAERLQ